MVAEIFFEYFQDVKGRFFTFLWMTNSTIEHDTTELITSFHSESTAHSNDINISYCEKISKIIGENPLL